MNNKKGLGKGLGALLTDNNSNDESSVKELKINEIEPNNNQPRKKFDDEKLKTLSESIMQHGIVQPIIVRKDGNIYRIVAGERRWRAARLAGLKTVPVVIKELTNKQVMEIAIIENIQREDLNPIEEAEAFDRLLNEYNMTQEELSNSIGKSRSAIANTIRLLGLNEKVKEHLINGEITSGHARALLSINEEDLQIEVCKEVIEKNLSVRETESLVKKNLKEKNKVKIRRENRNEEIIKIEEDLKNIFGTKVKLLDKNNKGKILIEYYSNDDLERILEVINESVKK